MTPDQETLLRAWADFEPRPGAELPTMPNVAIQALTRVVLELTKDSHPPVDIRSVVREELRERVNQPRVANECHSLRLQMENAVEDLSGHLHAGPSREARRQFARMVVDNLLDILDQDPGHQLARAYAKEKAA